MPRISVCPDRAGRQAVYCGRTLLLDGLAEREAEAFAAFFQAADGGRSGAVRTGKSRTGIVAAQGGRTGIL